MYQQLSPSSYFVKEPFRWRGVLLAEESGLPNDMPQGVIRSFVRKGLIAERNGEPVQASARKKTAKKTTKATTTRRKTAKKKKASRR